jgi:class 3 adenylate cyclase
VSRIKFGTWERRIRAPEGTVSGSTRAGRASFTNMKPEGSISLPEDYYLNTMDANREIKSRAVQNRCNSILQALEGRTMLVTAVSVDVVNSSQTVQKLSSESAVEYYRNFIENTSEIVQNYGGYVLKNVGDCVLSFFPSSRYIIENHDSAVFCGLAIRDMIKEWLSMYLMERDLPSISCRVSADFGPAAVLMLTSNGGYSAIDLFGSVINSASKIARYAKPNQMVIGYNLLSKLIDMEDLEFKCVNHFDLRGKHSYQVYVVERRK